MNTAGRLRAVLSAQAESGLVRVVVELSGLEFMGCRGMHALLDAQDALMARGGTMALAGPRPVVAHALELAGVDQRIPVYDGVQAAVAGRIVMPEIPCPPAKAGGSRLAQLAERANGPARRPGGPEGSLLPQRIASG